MQTVPLPNWSVQFKVTQPGLYSCGLTADLIRFEQIRALVRSCDRLVSHGRSLQANEKTQISLSIVEAMLAWRILFSSSEQGTEETHSRTRSTAVLPSEKRRNCQ